MSDGVGTERRAEERRQDADRREGRDRRRGADRRKKDAGPPAGVAERRTGWDRRIADRRSGGDRRSGLDRRDPTPEVLLRAVTVQTARQLVSRLYLQVSRTPKSSQRACQHLETARAELLTPRPNLERVATELDGLKSTSAAKLPEYGLARALLRPLRANHKGRGGGTESVAQSLRRRDSLEHLRATLTAPLGTPDLSGNPKDNGAPSRKKSARASKTAKKSKQKSTGKKKSARSRTPTSKKGGRSAR